MKNNIGGDQTSFYCDFNLDYFDTSIKNFESKTDLYELIISAICDKYHILGLNVNKNGILGNNDVQKLTKFKYRVAY
jgi:hypothetical protein